MIYRQKVNVISNQEIMPGTHLIWLKSAEIASTARPGQFVMITCGNEYEHLLRRPISIHQIKRGELAILFSIVGKGTERLALYQTGEKIDLLGPLGNGFSIFSETRNLLLVAGGMGFAPLCFLTRQALEKNCRVKLLIGARTASGICPDQLIPDGCDTVITTEDGSLGQTGLVTTLLPQYVNWADQIFVCGPVSMFKAITKDYSDLLRKKSTQVSLEVRMGCGLGFCYACTINTVQGLKQVCKDGPVFEMSDIVWDKID